MIETIVSWTIYIALGLIALAFLAYLLFSVAEIALNIAIGIRGVLSIFSRKNNDLREGYANQRVTTISKFEEEEEHKEPEKREFRPWTEENLIWQGKRKLWIEYIDRHGDITERDIEIRGVWPDEETGEIHFRAMCHLRNEWRTFNANGVLSIRTAKGKEFDDFSSFMYESLNI